MHSESQSHHNETRRVFSDSDRAGSPVSFCLLRVRPCRPPSAQTTQLSSLIVSRLHETPSTVPISLSRFVLT